MEKRCPDEKRWTLPTSTDNALELRQVEEEDDEDEEEALSLSDLPLIHQSRKEKEEEEEESTPLRGGVTEEDFDFCSFSKESEMCAADEVFFQGQILPLRHSISSEKGSLQYSGQSISRSESMDHYYSGRLISSRSSSISSHQSSSSGSSSAATGGAHNYKPKLPPRNHFHSHPSPSPRLHFSSYNQRITPSNHRNSVKKSSIWNTLRLGLVTSPPEIAFHDLKTRCPSNNSTNCKNFGSRNSTSSNCSSIISSTSNSISSKKKKARAFLGGCKCSVDAVDTVASRVVIIKRSASESDVEALHHQRLRQENIDEAIKQPKLTKKQAAKKHLSHHRTFEWLKQLSVEGTADEA